MRVDWSATVERFATLMTPWSTYVADHPAVSTAIVTAHVTSLFVAGGIAVATDRQLLRQLDGETTASPAVLTLLADAHGVVIPSLLLTIASGWLLLLADVGTFAGSAVFWSKMTVLLVLWGNGVRLRRAESALLRAVNASEPLPIPTGGERNTPLSRLSDSLRHGAAVSLFCWVTLVVLGVVLGNS